jgi:pimeloyl-ACP methyl ester carboxylesterase
MAILEVDGARLVYEVEGRGERALAFAHGWCSMSSHWDAQVAGLGASHRIVRWDRRGMGRSTAEHPADSPARHADDLAAILDAEGISRVTVVGHAGGGPSALTFADRFAHRTEALVLVDTSLHAPPEAGGEDRLAAGYERSCQRLLGADGPAYLRSLYRSFFGPRAADEIVAAALDNALATPKEIAVAEMRHMLGDTVGMSGRIRCPVLWVSARPDDTAMAREAFADVLIGHVVGSGHFVPLEVPEQLNPMIEAFLGAKVHGAPPDGSAGSA